MQRYTASPIDGRQAEDQNKQEQIECRIDRY